MAKKRRKNPPSQKKYDEANPVVSFRVLKNYRERYLVMRRKRGTSHGDVYRAGLGILEKKMKDEEQIRQETYDEGLEKGIEYGEELYAVSCPCSKCGKKKTVINKDEKKAITRFMIANRWQHADCSDLYS